MNKNKVEVIGDLYVGHDGDICIKDDNGREYDIYAIVDSLGICKYIGDKTRIKLSIENLESI